LSPPHLWLSKSNQVGQRSTVQLGTCTTNINTCKYISWFFNVSFFYNTICFFYFHKLVKLVIVPLICDWAQVVTLEQYADLVPTLQIWPLALFTVSSSLLRVPPLHSELFVDAPYSLGVFWWCEVGVRLVDLFAWKILYFLTILSLECVSLGCSSAQKVLFFCFVLVHLCF